MTTMNHVGRRSLILLAALLLLPSALASIEMDRSFFEVGETVTLSITNAGLDRMVLYIYEGQGVYQYVGLTYDPISFIPQHAGEYRLVLKDDAGMVREEAAFQAIAPAGTAQIPLVEPFLPTSSPLRKHEPSFLPAAMANDRFVFLDSRGMPLNADIRVEAEQGLVAEGHISDIQTGIIVDDLLDLSIRPRNHDITFLRFRGVRHQSTMRLGIDDVDPSTLVTDDPLTRRFVRAFAIDPEALDFAYGSFTFQATGHELWKCKDYDFMDQECFGEYVKVQDLIPGRYYTVYLTPEDPLFSQTGYLTNPSFENDTNGWSTLSESGSLVYSWVASDAGQSGVAEITNTRRNKDYIGNYYQVFTLTHPAGTAIDHVNFTTKWRINQYDQPGNVYVWIQDGAQTVTYCSYSSSFSSTTSWNTATVSTLSPSCSVSNFNNGSSYTFRLRCNLVTGTSIRDERCHWDDNSVMVYYNDTQNASIRSFSDSPDPVDYGETINFTANVTDNIAVDQVWVEIDGANYSMVYSPASGLYFNDTFGTSITPGLYTIHYYANDTSDNVPARNTSSFTISDTTLPDVHLITPPNENFSNTSDVTFVHNVSDVSVMENCTLYIDGQENQINTTINKAVDNTFDATVAYGLHNWSVLCVDEFGNEGWSTAWNITMDDAAPNVSLLGPADLAWTNKTLHTFSYIPLDDYLINCSLWGNFAGSWALNQIDYSPRDGSSNDFNADLDLDDGIYLWNVVCWDRAENSGTNATNYTLRIDATPPAYSGLGVLPASGTGYVQGASYQLNATWADVQNPLDDILFESNFSGSIANDIPTGNNGAEYYYDLVDLAAGTYQYRWIANDTVGNQNETAWLFYTVAKAQSVVDLALNGTDGNVSVGMGGEVNITGYLITPATGYIELYREGVLINSGYDFLENVSQFNLEQAYNITAKYPATQNHSEVQETHWVIVTDTTPPTSSLGNPVNNSFQQENITFYFTPDDNIDLAMCWILLDGAKNESDVPTIGVENSITVYGIGQGTHNWTVNCTDSEGNEGTNESYKQVRIDQTIPGAFDLYAPASGTASTVAAPTLQWDETTEDNFRNYTLQVDNDPAFLSINFVYTTFDITDTSIDVPAGWPDQVMWYWKVLAFDEADNYRESSSVFNYTIDAVAPVVNLLNPGNDSWSSSIANHFEFDVSDFTGIQNCSIYVNGTLNQTNHSINKSTTQNFTIDFSTDGSYAWSISCYDSANNSGFNGSYVLNVSTDVPGPFNLSTPPNNTLGNDSSPYLNWTESQDDAFANYTVYVSDDPGFSYLNFTYVTYGQGTAFVDVPDVWPDTAWHWYVTARHYPGEGTNSTYPFVYRLDSTPPAVFDLDQPVNNTASTDLTPTLNWSETSDPYFDNYTILVSETEDFALKNFTYSTSPVTSNEFTPGSDWPANYRWYWKVVAYDQAENTRNSTDQYLYITDALSPTIWLEDPANHTEWTTSSAVTFAYNVSDLSGIANCSLIIDGAVAQTEPLVQKDTSQSIVYSLENGEYNWSINCTDEAGNQNFSETRNITLNVQVPRNRLYETHDADHTSTANINLSYDYDLIQNSIQTSIASGTAYTMASAFFTVNGSGFIIYPNTLVNFSGEFMQSQADAGYVSWYIYNENASGSFPVCNHGNNNTGGALINAKNVIETLAGSCTTPSETLFLASGDRLRLDVNVYNSFTQTRSFDHYWDNLADSWIGFQGYDLGNLSLVIDAPTADPQPSEGELFNFSCNVTCTDGYCLNTQVSAQYNTSTVDWQDIPYSGANILLNGSSSNPVILGNLNTTAQVNYTLIGGYLSDDSNIRCSAESTYHNATSGAQQVSVLDTLAPNVTLEAPADGAAYDPRIIDFQYTPYDNRLQNCTLHFNESGQMVGNETNSTPANDSLNTFPLFLDYGVYIWNVYCEDTEGNLGFAEINWMLNIAGDLAVYSSDIDFSKTNPVEGEEVNISVVVRNLANKSESDVKVGIWDGDPDSGGTQVQDNVTVNLSNYGNATVNFTWTAVVGSHDIYAVIDPPYGAGDIVESDETNNKAYSTIDISVWQVYYGNFNSTGKLANEDDDLYLSWLLSNNSANIYIADSDTTGGISWSFLKPIYRNTTGSVTSDSQDDFEEIDSLLGIESIYDNVNTTYATPSGPSWLGSFYVYELALQDVPQTNSTSYESFTTGILWDSDDSSNDYFDSTDAEDLVFLTAVNRSQTGKYGTYDYEIRIPAALKDYKGGTSTVDFYYEIK